MSKPMSEKNSHCSYCGQRFADQQPWPRECKSCHAISYLNPTPVAVLVLHVDGGVLAVRRSIPPGKGRLALPGGYINAGESWQHAAARELFEETGIRIEPSQVVDHRVLSAPDGTVLIFGRATLDSAAQLAAFAPTDETSEITVLRAPQELAFSLHTQVLHDVFAGWTPPGAG
jgi:ADP-ribose pyrophosphatase YjhB (NUDIX family)